MKSDEYFAEMNKIVDRLIPPPVPDELKRADTRTYIATAAMNGFISSIGIVGGVAPSDEDIARYSVNMADALLAALAEPTP